MIPGPPAMTPANPANYLLQPVPYFLVTGTIETPKGIYGIITLRHPAGEVTAYVTREEILGWEHQLHELGLLVSPAGLHVVRGTGGIGDLTRKPGQPPGA
jgi:hypothetical protein